MGRIHERLERSEGEARDFLEKDPGGVLAPWRYLKHSIVDPLNELLAVPAAIVAALLLVGSLVSLAKSIVGAF